MPLKISKVFTSDGQAPVYCIEALNEHSFFSGGGSRLVHIHDLNDPSSVKPIVNTGSAIYSMKYIGDKNILLIGVSGGGMHVIDMVLKKETRFLVNHEKGIFKIIHSEKFNKILTAGGDGKISCWSATDFSFIKSLSLCQEKIREIIFDKDENNVIAGCGDGYIRTINLDDFSVINEFKAHDSSVNSLCFHPYLDILISGGKDAHLNFWKVENFDLIESLPAHNYAIYSIVFSPTFRYFATCSRDKNIKIWNGESFEILTRINAENNNAHVHSVNKLIWFNEMLLSAGDDRKLFGWKIED